MIDTQGRVFEPSNQPIRSVGVYSPTYITYALEPKQRLHLVTLALWSLHDALATEWSDGLRGWWRRGPR